MPEKFQKPMEMFSNEWKVKNVEGMINDARRWLREMNPDDAARLKADLKSLAEEK